MARWSALACLLVSAAASGRAAEGVEQILAKVEQSYRSAKCRFAQLLAALLPANFTWTRTARRYINIGTVAFGP